MLMMLDMFRIIPHSFGVFNPSFNSFLQAFLMGVLCNWQRIDRTSFLAMAVLHGQTQNAMFAKQAVDTARESVIPGLLIYSSGGHILLNESLPADLRPRDLLNITVRSQNSEIITMGIFDYESHVEQAALVEILLTLFVIIVWIIGLLFFVGPVMILVSTKIDSSATQCILQFTPTHQFLLWNRLLIPSSG